jgi:energy-converting hydrogenase Eha subunit A
MVFAYSFKDFVLVTGIRERSSRFIWVVASVLYSIIIASVAIQYINGFIIAFCLIGIYGFVILGMTLHRSGKPFLFGHTIVIQYYLLSYVIALGLIIIYIAIFGFKNRNDS